MTLHETDKSVTVVYAALAVIADPSFSEVVISLRKGESHLGGFWEFPGGKLEPEESPEHCAVREAKEEVGLDVEVVRSLGDIDFTYRERVVKLFPFLCRSEKLPVFAHGSEEARWVRISSLTDYRFPPANDSIIELLNDAATTLQYNTPIDGTREELNAE